MLVEQKKLESQVVQNQNILVHQVEHFIYNLYISAYTLYILIL